MNDLGKVIKEKRKEKALSQSELGRLTGISQETISAYEKGVRKPSIENIEKLSCVLCYDLFYNCPIQFDENERKSEIEKSILSNLNNFFDEYKKILYENMQLRIEINALREKLDYKSGGVLH